MADIEHRITIIDGGITNRTEGRFAAKCVKECGWVGREWFTTRAKAENDGDEHVIAVTRSAR